MSRDDKLVKKPKNDTERLALARAECEALKDLLKEERDLRMSLEKSQGRDHMCATCWALDKAITENAS